MDEAADKQTGATRRRALLLGAAGSAAVLTIRPALAQTHASVMTCSIPVPDARHAGQYVAADGSLVAPGTAGAYPPPGRAIPGEAVRQAMASGGTLPGYSSEQSRAYLAYIRRLQRGTGGFTCFASLQMPRG